MPERRQHRRIDLELPALVRKAEATTGGSEATIVNLGPEGAFLLIDDPPGVGSAVLLEFRIESYGAEINVRGEILWRREGDVSGVGMRFTDIPLFEKNAIGDFILRKVAEMKSGKYD